MRLFINKIYLSYAKKKIATIKSKNNLKSVDELKNICQVEHSRHRSVANFMTNLVAGIIAYNSLPKKPSLKYETAETNQLALFF